MIIHEKSQEGGGSPRGARRVFEGFGGGGAKYFFCGPKFPPSLPSRGRMPVKRRERGRRRRARDSKAQCDSKFTTRSKFATRIRRPQMSGRRMSGTSRGSPRHFLNWSFP